MAKPKSSLPKTLPEKIVRSFLLAVRARGQAHAPYSKFKVGASLVTADGAFVTGCNVENASYGGTVCAERVAILKSVSEGISEFSDIVVVTDAPEPAYPCAFCLQVMAEFFAPETKIWIGDLERIHGVHRFDELLPFPFGPRQLKAAADAKKGRKEAR